MCTEFACVWKIVIFLKQIELDYLSIGGDLRNILIKRRG